MFTYTGRLSNRLTPTSNKDCPSSTESVVDDRYDWQRADSSQGVHGTNDALQSSRRVSKELFPGIDNLNSVDHLRVEARRDLNSHACRKEQQIQIAQIRLLVPWHLVMLNSMGEHWVCCAGRLFGTSADSHVDCWVSRMRSSKKCVEGGLS
jgi:hypothetical protein